MSQNTEDNTSELLIEKQEISEASLDGVSGGKGGAGLTKASKWVFRAVEVSAGVIGIGTAVKQTRE